MSDKLQEALIKCLRFSSARIPPTEVGGSFSSSLQESGRLFFGIPPAAAGGLFKFSLAVKSLSPGRDLKHPPAAAGGIWKKRLTLWGRLYLNNPPAARWGYSRGAETKTFDQRFLNSA